MPGIMRPPWLPAPPDAEFFVRHSVQACAPVRYPRWLGFKISARHLDVRRRAVQPRQRPSSM